MQHRIVAPHTKPVKVDLDGAAAVDLVVSTIGDRIGNGELKSGQALNQGALADELGVTRFYMQMAIEQLVRTGALGYSGLGRARRCVVVG
jgi:DNA-binding GntR family transcriptional regulator